MRFDMTRLSHLHPFEHGGFRAVVDGVGGWGETQEAAVKNAAQNAAKRRRWSRRVELNNR